MATEDELLLQGRIGVVRPEDVLQFVAACEWPARIVFETEDRVTGDARAVELEIARGRLFAIGPRGAGLRLGDLAVAYGLSSRGEIEELATRGPWLGQALLERGRLDETALADLLWERAARVVWGLLAWDRGWFRVTGGDPIASDAPGADPPPLGALLLDGLQRAESALGALRSEATAVD